MTYSPVTMAVWAFSNGHVFVATKASLRHSSFVLIIPLLRCVMVCSYYTKFKRKGKLISLPSDPNTVVGVGRTITGIINKTSGLDSIVVVFVEVVFPPDVLLVPLNITVRVHAELHRR